MKNDWPTLIPTWLKRLPADMPVSLDSIRKLQRGLPPDSDEDPDDQEQRYEEVDDLRD